MQQQLHVWVLWQSQIGMHAVLHTTLHTPLPPVCRKLLVFNPTKRLSVHQALRHPYVAQFHNSADEPTCPGIIVLPISDNTK